MSTKTGGTATAVRSLRRAVQFQGIEVVCYTTSLDAPPQSIGLTPSWLREATTGHTFDNTEPWVHAFELSRPARFAYSRPLEQALRHLDGIDVVHIHSLFLFPQYIAMKSAADTNTPFVVSPHGALDPFLRRKGRLRKFATDLTWQRQLFERASVVHATSDVEKNWIQDCYRVEFIEVQPIPVELDQFSSVLSARLANSQYPNSPLTILNHGRLAEKKGLSTLVEALPQVRRAFPSVRLRIVGPDDEGLGANLLDLAKQLGVAESVELVGHKTGSDLIAELQAADVWALPSRGENFGVAVVEAMAAGLPVVTTNLVNLAPDASNVGALRIASPDAESFADEIITIGGTPRLARELAIAGARYAQRYEPRRLGAAFEELYRRAMESKRM